MPQTLIQTIEKVQQEQLKPTVAVEASLDKIAKHQDLNIFITTFPEAALKQAQSLEAKLRKGETVGRLAGAVFCVKDNFLYRNTITTAAAPFLTNFKAPYTATCLQKLLDEDAILIGKTNLDAFAHGTSTENSYFKASKNPHDTQMTPGGSSGGSASAVAVDICSFSLGTDTGGSVRLPASFCGVVGFKPTYGLLSRYGLVAMASSTDCVASFSHTPSDALLLMEILQGKDSLDGTTLTTGDLVKSAVQTPKTLKVGVIEEFTRDLDEDVQQAFNQALERMRSLGWQVEMISLPSIELALACYYVLVSAEISSNLSRYDGLRYGQSVAKDQSWQTVMARNRDQGFMAENKRRIMLGTYVLSQGYYEAYYRKAQQLRTLLNDNFSQAWAKVDCLVSPTSPTTAFALGSKVQNPVQMYAADLMTVAASLVGIPASSIPIHTQGLPVGLQIMTPQRTDGLNLKIAQKVFEA